MKVVISFFIVFVFSLKLYTAQAQNRRIPESVKQTLEEIYNRDQVARFHLDSAQKKFGANSDTVKNLWLDINQKDSLNKALLFPILKSYGWLSKQETSKKANASFFLVIQHAELNTQINYLPLLKEAIKAGKANPEDYAFLKDRINMKQGKYQIFGTQVSGDYQGNLCFWPIVNEPLVNKRRLSIGLSKLEDYANDYKIIYKRPTADSLKGKIILNGYVSGIKHQALNDVKVFDTHHHLLAITNKDGTFKTIVSRSLLKHNIVLKKSSYKTVWHLLKNTGEDVFFLEFVMIETSSDTK